MTPKTRIQRWMRLTAGAAVTALLGTGVLAVVPGDQTGWKNNPDVQRVVKYAVNDLGINSAIWLVEDAEREPGPEWCTPAVMLDKPVGDGGIYTGKLANAHGSPGYIEVVLDTSDATLTMDRTAVTGFGGTAPVGSVQEVVIPGVSTSPLSTDEEQEKWVDSGRPPRWTDVVADYSINQNLTCYHHMDRVAMSVFLVESGGGDSIRYTGVLELTGKGDGDGISDALNPPLPLGVGGDSPGVDPSTEPDPDATT